jgi:pimeloyl-ACP methyl ester carboxylesterase
LSDQIGTLLVALVIILLLLLCVGFVYQAFGSARGMRKYPPPGRLVDVGGFRLHINCAGTGSPSVVLESGIGASSLSWGLVQPEVAKFTRVCSYDRAGLGWSDPAPPPRTCSRISDELDRLLLNAGIPGPYVLVGHSFGGYVVRHFATRYPDKVAGMVLVDTIHPSEWLNPTAQQKRMLRGAVFFSYVGAWLARLGIVRFCLDLLTGGSPQIPRRVIKLFGRDATGVVERILGEVRKFPPEAVPIVKTIWCLPKCFESMAEHLASLPISAGEIATTGLAGEFPLTVLTSGIHGPKLRMESESLAGQFTGSQHILASESGHWIQLDEPRAVVDAIREVVEAVRAGKPRQ